MSAIADARALLDRITAADAVRKVDGPAAVIPPPPATLGELVAKYSLPVPLAGKPLYAALRVLPGSAEALKNWMADAGIVDPVAPEALHITTVYSRTPVPAFLPATDAEAVIDPVEYKLGILNDCLVMFVDCYLAEASHSFAASMGASWDHPEYRPHITLSYTSPATVPAAPPPFALQVGREYVQELKPDNGGDFEPVGKTFGGTYGGGDPGSTGAVRITKSNDSIQTVWGFFSVVEKDGRPVVDLQGDVISPDVLRSAAHDFITNSRVGGILHAEDDGGRAIQVGEAVESVVFTSEVQKALGIDLGCVGWFGAIHYPDEILYGLVRDGRVGAFSIGGTGARHAEEID